MPELPQCPGCHIGCNLAVPGCGRGIDFAARARAGEEIPVRNLSGGRPSGGRAGSKPASAMTPSGRGPNPADHLASLLVKALPGALAAIDGMVADDATAVLQWIARMEGRMARSVMPVRIRGIDTDALDDTLELLIDERCLSLSEIEGRAYYVLTDAGRIRAEAFEERRVKAVQQAFSGLDAEELQAMIGLCHKVLEASRT